MIGALVDSVGEHVTWRARRITQAVKVRWLGVMYLVVARHFSLFIVFQSALREPI